MRRLRFDIGWLDLLNGLRACASPRARTALQQNLERATEDSLACLSVRGGFDSWLESMRFPAKSEILLSAVTIPHMARIVQAHGLVPVPDPAKAVRRLREAGFDATYQSRLVAVDSPNDRSELDPQNARRLFSHVAFVPWYPELPLTARNELLAQLAAEPYSRPVPSMYLVSVH